MSKAHPQEQPRFESAARRGREPAAHRDVGASTAQIGAAPAWSASPRQSTQQAQIRALASAATGHVGAPAQLSKGSSQANEELVKSMGKAAKFVDKTPKAKPHTKKGQGTTGTDHQGRNAQVINKSKQDTMQNHGDPTMFQNSQMRTAEKAPEKAAAAQSIRAEKKKRSKEAELEAIADFWGTTVDDLTPDEIKEYRKMHRDE